MANAPGDQTKARSKRNEPSVEIRMPPKKIYAGLAIANEPQDLPMQELLKSDLDYDPLTGEFKRKYATSQFAAGSVIGWLDRYGHRYVTFNATEYRASRLAALYMTGSLPKRALYHKDRNNSNDAWENLTASRPPLDQKRLKELLHYDPETGVFRWLVSKRGNRGVIAGDIAGCVGGNGYWVISVERHRDTGHRFAWLYMTGEWPENEVDHVDRDRANNRWENLRAATRQQNTWNVPGKKNRTNGFRGVRKSRYGKYEAIIHVGEKWPKYLGTYETPEEAHAAYCKAANELRGEFASTD